MELLVVMLGRLAAVAAEVICLGAGAMRVFGAHQILGFETVTLFIGGIALMVLGCLAKFYRGELG